MCPIHMTVGHAQTLPLQQEGGERRERERGVWGLFPLPKPGTDDARLFLLLSSSFSFVK